MSVVIERKHLTAAEVKAVPGKPGQVEALVAVFGNVDLGGDRIVKGAFERTLEERGFPAVVWSHRWDVVPIGATLEAEEVSGFKTRNGPKDGLRVLYELFIDDHSTAREVWKAQTTLGGDGLPTLREFSFGYAAVKATTIDDEEFEAVDATHWRDLLDVELFEIGPTLVGMNPETELVGAKAIRKALAGEKLDGSDRRALDALAAVLPTSGKKATPFTASEKAPDGTPWDGDAERGRADVDDLRSMSAWHDSDSPDEKSSYLLLHHRADAGHPVVWRGVRSAMSALLSERVEIPLDDRKAVYDHLARHFEQFDKNPPELRSYTTDEMKSLGLDDEPASPAEAREIALAFPR